jgi:RHS repeat-associated protein
MFLTVGGFTTPAALTPRDGVALAYDPLRHVYVMFGGYDGTNFLAQTWLYYPNANGDTGSWVQASPTVSPPARYVASAVWDGATGRVMVMGGVQNSQTFDDAWEFTGSTWVNVTPLAPKVHPTFRWGQGLSYDSANNQVVMFGGCYGSTILGDTWVFDGVSDTWTQKVVSPAPSARCAFGQTYNAASGQTLLFGGYSGSVLNGDTWSWSGSAWTLVASTGPSARDYVLMDYDTDAGEPVLYGGYNAGATYNDTWRWDGTRWDLAAGVAAPPGRYATALAYDPEHSQHMFFGGFGLASNNVGRAPAGYLNDTWVASHATPTVTQTLSPAGPLVSGQVATLTLQVGNPSSLPHQVYGLTDALPAGFTPTGAGVRFGSSMGTLCTSATVPSCTLSSSRMRTGGFQLAAGGSLTFVMNVVATGTGTGSGAAACPTTAGFLPQAGVSSFYASQVLADNPSAYYRLDDTSPTAADLSGHAQNGSYLGSYSLGTASGMLSDADKSVTLSGGSVSLPGGLVPANLLPAGFTFTTWVNPSDVVANATLFRAWASASGDGTTDDFMLTRDGTSNGVAFTLVKPGGTFTFSAPHALLLNSWQQITLTVRKDPTTATAADFAIYRNGNLLAGAVLNNPPVISRDQTRLGNGSFHGGLDDTAFFSHDEQPASAPFVLWDDANGAGAGSNVASVLTQNSDTYGATVANNFTFFYKLDEAAGPNALDSGGFGNTAAYQNPNAVPQPFGFGKDPALANTTESTVEFSGGFVALPAGGSGNAGDSTEAWIRPTAASNNARIFDQGAGAGLDEISFGRQGTTNNLIVEAWGGTNGTTYGSVVAPNALTLNQWQDVAFTMTAGGAVVIYKNGVQIASGTVPAMRNVTRQYGWVGRSLWAGADFWQGGIADLGLSGAVWTPDMLARDYAAGTGLPGMGVARSALAPQPVCDSRLGMQNWWSYQNQDTGDQASAHVNVSNGNLVLSQTDSTVVQAHGRLAYVQRRFYNSQDTGALPGGTFARGWQLGMGHTDDVASAGLDATGLVVPQAETVLQPLAVTLVDRTGTHLTYQPNLTTWNPNTNLSNPLPGLVAATGSLLAPVSPVLTGLASNKTLCLDMAYTPPPGVHAGLWRYVAVGLLGPNACAQATVGNTTVVGWVLERPDRMREEFAPSGELLDLIDPAGVDLRYVYDNAFGTVGSGVTPNKLRAVYEPASSACTLTGSGASTSLGAACRGELLSYSTDTPANPSCTGLLPALGSPANWMCVLDPAGRPTLYGFDGSVAGTRHLTGVVDPDRRTTRYTYGSGTDCTVGGVSTAGAATVDQVCAVTDRAGSTTRFTYTAASDAHAFGTVGNGALPVVSRLLDRRGLATFVDYGGGSATTVDAAPSSSTSSCVGNSACHRRVYASLDAAGRVGELDEGTSSAGSTGPWLRTTLSSWDGGSRTCRSDGQVDNDLCEQVRDSYTSTQNQDTTFQYGPTGELLNQHQVLGVGGLDTSFGYHLQQLHTDGLTSCSDETVHGSGQVTTTTSTAAGCTSSTSPVLYTLADRTQALGPRGNAAGSSFGQYLTTYRVDDLATSAPNQAPSGGVCGSTGAATSNTGVVCETDQPASAGVTTPLGACQATLTAPAAVACTRYQYNAQGQKTAMTTPNAAVHGDQPYRYVYYTDSELDLSGQVSAGGWLKAVVDPTASYGTAGDARTATSHFVAFGYDRAGNQVRTWDRNATSNTAAAVSGYPSAGSGSYTESDYGPYLQAPAGATSFSAPWRDLLSRRDQLGDLTSYTVDANGNALTIRPPRGNQAGNGSFDTTQQFDNNDELTSRTLPLGSSDGTTAGTWSYGYDGFGNQILTTDPNHHLRQAQYDAVDRQIAARWSRTTDPAQAPAACRAASGDPVFPNGTFVCTSSSSFDGTDSVLATQDGNGHTTTYSYDGLGRRTDTLSPRDNNGISTVHTAVRYDADSNVTDTCSGREFTEGSGSCTSTSVYATHATFDPTGRPSSITSYRQSGQVLLRCTSYDANGNTVSLTDANASGCGDPNHTRTFTVNALDRTTATSVPRSTGVALSTSTSYDPNGNVLAVTPPAGTDGAPRATAYSYDAANRLLDAVQAADNPAAAQAGLPDSNGGVNVRTRLVYDADGNLTGTFGPRAFAVYTDSNGTQVADPRTSPNPDFLVTTGYDQNDRPVTQASPRYDNGPHATDLSSKDGTVGNAQQAQCPTGASGYPASAGVCTLSVSYDAAGNRLRVTLPTATGPASNRNLQFHYTDDNLLATVDAPNPAADGQRLNGIGGNPWAAQYRYDADGKRTHSIDAQGRDTITGYTGDELVATVTAPANGSITHISSVGYDANGNTVTSTDPLGQATISTYTADDRLATLTDPAGDRTSYSYDNNGNPISVLSPSGNAADATNPFGWPTTSSYTFDNLLASTITPIAATTTAVATGRRTDYGYDQAGRKTSAHTYTLALTRTGATLTPGATLTDAGTQALSYLPDDRLASVTGRAVNSPLSTNASGTQSYRYDAAGNPISLADSSYGSGTSTTASFYADGLPRTTNDGSRTTSYAYDGSGAPTLDSYGPAGAPDNTSTTSYTDAGQPQTHASSLTTGTWTWSYDTLGRPVTATQPNNTTAAWSYNNDGTLAETTLSRGTSTLSDYTYTYDALYRITSQTLPSSAAAAPSGQPATGTYTINYDTAGRVSTFTDVIPGTSSSRTTHYSWDHDSNRVAYGPSVTQGVGVTTSNPCLPTATVGATPGTSCASYHPDDSLATQSDTLGVLHSVTEDSAGRIQADGCHTYNYDGFDRTSRVVTLGSPCPSAPNATYTYDALNRQTSHTETPTVGTASNTTVNYAGLTPDIREENPTNVPGLPGTIHYDNDPTGAPLLAAAGTNQQFLTSDGHHNTALLTDNTGGVLCTARYDAFGNPEAPSDGNTWDTTQHTCATADTSTQPISDMFYRQGRHDQATGNYQLGARTYDPTKGTFTTSDSSDSSSTGGDPSVGTDPLTRNTYSYVNGDPINLTDPSGHMPCAEDENGHNYCSGSGRTFGAALTRHNNAIIACRHSAACQRQNAELALEADTAIAVSTYQGSGMQDCIQFALRNAGAMPCGQLGLGHFVKPADGGIATISFRVPGTRASILCEGYTQSCVVIATADVTVQGTSLGSLGAIKQVQQASKLDALVNGVEANIYVLALASLGARTGPAADARSLGDLYAGGRVATEAELRAYAESQGWTLEQTATGPAKYVDENGIPRLTIKSGSSRTPGSEDPHIEVRNETGQRTDPFGNPVNRRSPDNHYPYEP